MNLTTLAASLLALAAGCATDPTEPTVVAPDAQVFAALYPTAARQDANAPFNVDLGACPTARFAVPSETGDQFVLSHLTADGRCQLWLGYDETSPAQIIHTDIYCELEPTGDANVVLASPASSGAGGCGGPPGAPVLSIASARCIPISQ